MFRLKLVAVSGALLMGASLSSLLAQGGCQDPLASNYAPDTSSDNSDCIYLDHAFQETGTENASSPTNGALFGQAFQVDPSDGQMVVGAPGDDSPGATSEGSVTILEEEEGCGFYSPELLTAPDGQDHWGCGYRPPLHSNPLARRQERQATCGRKTAAA